MKTPTKIANENSYPWCTACNITKELGIDEKVGYYTLLTASEEIILLMELKKRCRKKKKVSF